jgi:hypothetical protein
MYILSADTEHESGAFAVEDDFGIKVIYFFTDYDDADRYLGLLEAEDYPPMKVLEVENEVAIKACEMYNYKYAVIKSEDVVITPRGNVVFKKN